MHIAIAGATGQLGQLVIDALLKRGTRPQEIVALGRSEEKLASFAARGIETRHADYNVPQTLRSAVENIDKLLLISSSSVGQRVVEHENVINAAREMNVSLLAYTSMANAPTSGIYLAEDHLATERLLAASGLDYVLLRNGWYTENYTDQVMGYLNSGVVLGCARDGKISAAPRADYAEAAAAVLLSEHDQSGKIYELGGKAFTLQQLAGAVGAAAGQQVEYRDMEPEILKEIYHQSGLDVRDAALLVETDQKIAQGALEVSTDDLVKLLGRPATSLGRVVKQVLAE